MKVNRFIFNSRFATLTNDDSGVISVNIPNNFTVAAGQAQTFPATATIGQPGAQIRCLLSTSADGRQVPGNAMVIMLNSDQGSLGASISVSRVGTTTARLAATIENPYGPAATFTGQGQTITASVNTFVDPFGQ
jgi:hypothetical protein